MQQFYAVFGKLGGLIRLLGIVWWVEAVWAGDHVHVARLAPAAALWLAKLLWAALVAAAVRRGGGGTTPHAEGRRPLSPVASILEQLTPSCCVCACTYYAWSSHVPAELLGDTWWRQRWPQLAPGAGGGDEPVAAAAAAELSAAVLLGVLLALLAIAAPSLYHRAGLLQSAWPPDPVPGLEEYHAADLAEKARQRAQHYQIRQGGLGAGGGLMFAVSRAARLVCLALSEELLYRGVLYSWLGARLGWFASTDPATVISSGEPTAAVPGLLSALCFGATFRAYHGEWVVGVATGWLLQVAAQRNQSLAPSIVAHTVMELALDAYRRRRPIPKPVSSEHVEGLHTI